MVSYFYVNNFGLCTDIFFEIQDYSLFHSQSEKVLFQHWSIVLVFIVVVFFSIANHSWRALTHGAVQAPIRVSWWFLLRGWIASRSGSWCQAREWKSSWWKVRGKKSLSGSHCRCGLRHGGHWTTIEHWRGNGIWHWSWRERGHSHLVWK